MQDCTSRDGLIDDWMTQKGGRFILFEICCGLKALIVDYIDFLAGNSIGITNVGWQI